MKRALSNLWRCGCRPNARKIAQDIYRLREGRCLDCGGKLRPGEVETCAPCQESQERLS